MKNNLLRDQFSSQIKAAKDADMFQYMFLAFGSLLGYVRNRGVIEHDNDMDVGFLTHALEKAQYDHYIESLEKYGCFKNRRKQTFNQITKNPFWISIRKHPKENCWKCCNWFFFEHNGYLWHHKGLDSKIKGLPAKYLELGDYITFLGQKIRIPKYSGACLDFWYPDWRTPRKGGSSYGVLMNVKNWKDKKTWKIQHDI